MAVGEQTLNRCGATHAFPLHSAVRLTMPPQALQAIDRELRAEEAAAAQAAADKKAQEEAAAAHKKVGHALPQSICTSCVSQAEQLRRAEEARKAAAATPARVPLPHYTLHTPLSLPAVHRAQRPRLQDPG